MESVQRPVTFLKSTVPDSCRSSCPHASTKGKVFLTESHFKILKTMKESYGH